MFASKFGWSLFAGTLALAANPTLAAEPLPLDDTALGRITAQGIAEHAMPAWLPEPGERLAFLPAGAIAANPASADSPVLGVLRADRSAMAFERRDGGLHARIVQTATIDLPAAQAVGATMQSGGYQPGGGQSATNLAVAATLNGMGNFGQIRP